MQLIERRSVAGFMLMEVLVALLLAALAGVTWAGLHARALQAGRMGLNGALAAQLAQDLGERLRANRLGAKGLEGEPSPYQSTRSWAEQQGHAFDAASQACDGAARMCAPAEFAQADLAQWQAQVQRTLPGGAAFVEVDGLGGWAEVWLAWVDAQAVASDEAPQASGECHAGLAVPPDTGVRCLRARVAW
jgi:type IV pilus assembly protein PilV